MENIIFLDFDGPIYPNKVFLFKENRKPLNEKYLKSLDIHPFFGYWKACPYAISMLNHIYDISSCDLVISSSWADDRMHTKDSILRILNINEIEAPLHKDWRTHRHISKKREEQIAAWLKAHPTDNYIILDDHKSGDGLVDKDKLIPLGINPDNVFLADEEEGLSYEIYLKMIEVIKKW